MAIGQIAISDKNLNNVVSISFWKDPYDLDMKSPRMPISDVDVTVANAICDYMNKQGGHR